MSAPLSTAPAELPPLATIHAQRFAARRTGPGVAEVALINPAFHCTATVTREELAALAGHLAALADTLDETPGAGLVTPQAAGRLVVPGQ